MSKADFILSQEVLNNYFEYCNGELYNKKARQRVKIGQKLGYITNNDGYIKVGLKGKYYFVHRLIYMMHYGYIPERIDHIDGNPANNRIENLRQVTNTQNCQNSKKRITNTSGYKNVHFRKDRQHWRVDIKINGKLVHFGSYKTVEEANQIAINVRNTYFKEFARHE